MKESIQVSAHTNTDDPLRIEVRLFGGPTVLVGGEAIKLSKYQSYLVALVFGHGEEGISRSRVIEFLWDEPDGVHQRHRLSQLLYGVNSKCGRKIINDDGGFLVIGIPDGFCDLTKVLPYAEAADVNCDGAVTPGDALEIFNRFLVGGAPEPCFAAQPGM